MQICAKMYPKMSYLLKPHKAGKNGRIRQRRYGQNCTRLFLVIIIGKIDVFYVHAWKTIFLVFSSSVRITRIQQNHRNYCYFKTKHRGLNNKAENVCRPRQFRLLPVPSCLKAGISRVQEMATFVRDIACRVPRPRRHQLVFLWNKKSSQRSIFY